MTSPIVADPFAAARAYADAAKAASEAGAAGAGESGGPAPLQNFAEMVQNNISDAAGAVAQTQQVTAAAIAGNAEIVDVVTAVAAAEVTLETALAVRDQVISAYQEILRMPI